MKIVTGKTASGYTMRVEGLVKSVEDSALFKQELTTIIESGKNVMVEVHVVDSYVVTSSIIGTLLKAINKDGAKLFLYAYQPELYELIEKLNLVDSLNVRKRFE